MATPSKKNTPKSAQKKSAQGAPKASSKTARAKQTRNVKKEVPAKASKTAKETVVKSSDKVQPKKAPQKQGVPTPPPIIDASFKNDRMVEIRGNVDLTANTVAKLQRALLLQSLCKPNDTSTVKLYLGPASSSQYRLQDQAALADAMVFVDRPVDVVVRSSLSPDLLKAFLSATGKRFMTAGANINLGPQTSSAPYGKNKANQVRRELFNDYKDDLQTLVMLKTGVKDRKKVYRDLLSARDYSALDALRYGTKGLVDGVLLNQDEVVTRADYDAFMKGKKWTEEQISDFCKHYINIYKLPKRKLKSISPQSIPDGTLSYYTPIKNKKKGEGDSANAPGEGKGTGDTALQKTQDGVTAKGPDTGKEKSNETKATPTPPQLMPNIYINDNKVDPIPPISRATKEKSPRRIVVDNIKPRFDGILYDDVIFFNDGFKEETAEQIGDALLALDHKKLTTQNKSHIKILENSPGGSVWSGQELRCLMKSLQTPVDVIVYGMGASCGSWLLCSATGNRLATPQARIMFHEAATQITQQTPHDHFNEALDGLDQATLDYIAIVAEATGRPFNEVLKDFDNDVWLNPVESLFYGPKGLIDAIVVSSSEVITRADVEKYLVAYLGNKSKLNRYIEDKLLMKRDPRMGMEWRPERHNDKDPFDNPILTIEAVKKTSAKKLSSLPKLKGSAPMVSQRTPEGSIDYLSVVIDDDKK